MIEPMPDKASEGGTDIQSLSDKLNEVIALLNRLTLPIRGEIREGNVQFLKWADEPKPGLRMGPGITRRPKEKP